MTAVLGNAMIVAVHLIVMTIIATTAVVRRIAMMNAVPALTTLSIAAIACRRNTATVNTSSTTGANII